MYITSLLPFVLLITLFVCLGSLLGRTLPVYRKLLPQLLTQKGYSPELEGLRGLLAVSVVIHHCVSWRSLLEQGSWEIHGANWGFNTQLGTYAVTMFFFLTGFLFWSKLINSEKVSFARFMYSRLWRLSPAYLGGALFLFVLVAVFSRFELHGSFGSLLRGMAEWSMFSVAGTPVLNGFAETNRLWVVTWSLRFSSRRCGTEPWKCRSWARRAGRSVGCGSPLLQAT